MPAPIKRIFITGAGGMLGSDLAQRLSQSFEILGAGLTPAPHLNIPYHIVDLCSESLSLAALSDFNPQVLFHCAALTDVDAYERRPQELLAQNAELVASVVKAANQTGAFLIFFSTDYVFDGSKQGEYLESDFLSPLNVYGKSKADAEKCIQDHANHFAIFRISWLYGFHGKSFPRTIWERAQTQDLFKVVSDQVGRPTYTKDIASAFGELFLRDSHSLEKMDREIFHLSNSGVTSWADAAEFILGKRGLGEGKRVERISSSQLELPAARPKNSVLSLKKSADLLSLRLRPWEEAMAEFLKELHA